ncbi:proton-coupled folate transporter [Biomphalaria glabrata]|nr:proton-coupled folate transporter [Biomphalaria glabrata]
MASSDDLREKTPLLPRKERHDKTPSFSVARARIVSVVIPVLTLSAAGANSVMMTQYIVAKLSDKNGLTSNETARPPCQVEANDSRAREADEIEAEASQFLTNLGFSLCGPAFITCLLFGSYGDYIGRRLNLILPAFTYLARMAITVLIVRLNLDLSYFYLAYSVEGLGGSWFAMLVSLFSLTADINKTKSGRTFWMTLISCSTTVTTAGANVAVGYLIKQVGFFYASLLLLGMMGLSFVIVLFSLQETLPAEKRPRSLGNNPLLYIRRIVSFYLFDGTLRRRATFCICMAVFIFGVSSEINLGSLDSLYQLGRPFCWDSTQIGNYIAIRSAGAPFLGTLLLKLLQNCLPEEKIGLLCILSQAVAMTFEAFIKVDWYFYFVPVLLIPESSFCPIVRSLMSVLAGADQQGALFASIAIMESLCQLVTMTGFNKIYALTVSYMPGAVYLVMASCGYTSLILFCIYFCIRERPTQQHELVINSPEGEKKLLPTIES